MAPFLLCQHSPSTPASVQCVPGDIITISIYQVKACYCGLREDNDKGAQAVSQALQLQPLNKLLLLSQKSKLPDLWEGAD